MNLLSTKRWKREPSRRRNKVIYSQIRRYVYALVGLTIAAATVNYSQTTAKGKQAPAELQLIRASLAYSEILLRKTELEADLESLLTEYTEDYPKVKEARFELASLQKETDRLLAVKPADSPKLTLALGKLVVRKSQLETELWNLLNQYKEGHPDVKRAKRKVEIFEKAIKEILG